MSESFPEIGKLLPHGPPMRLLDRVTEFDGNVLIAEVDIDADAAFHSDLDGVPAWVGLEYLGQAAAAYFALAADSADGHRPGMLVACQRYDCRQAEFAAGSTLQIRVHPVSGIGASLVRFEGEIHAAGKHLAGGVLSVYMGPGEQS